MPSPSSTARKVFKDVTAQTLPGKSGTLHLKAIQALFAGLLIGANKGPLFLKSSCCRANGTALTPHMEAFVMRDLEFVAKFTEVRSLPLTKICGELPRQTEQNL